MRFIIFLSTYLSDLALLLSWEVKLDVVTLICSWILKRLSFSFSLSRPLSDLWPVSLLAFRSFAAEWTEALGLSPAGAFNKYCKDVTKTVRQQTHAGCLTEGDTVLCKSERKGNARQPRSFQTQIFKHFSEFLIFLK